jgi:hypothetical protein
MHHAGGPPHGPPGPPHPGPGPNQVPEWAVMPGQGNDAGRYETDDGMMPAGPGSGAPAFCMLLGAGTLGAFVALLTVYVAKKAARKYCRSRTTHGDHLLHVGLAACGPVDGKHVHTNTGTTAYCPMA